jgi:hypothetical protein
MNERIKELVVQAQNYGYEVDYEKFAQLLINECTALITDMPNKMVGQSLSDYNRGWRNGRLLAKEQLEDHFGIV